MSEPRIVAVLRHEEEFRAAVRERVAELDITYDVIDLIAGYTEKYTGKLLAVPKAAKKFTAESRAAVLGTIGLREIRDDISWRLVEDAEALAKSMRNSHWRLRVEGRPKSMLSGGEHETTPIFINRRFMRKISRLGNAAYLEKISPRKRKKIAREAAKARWQRERERKERIEKREQNKTQNNGALSDDLTKPKTRTRRYAGPRMAGPPEAHKANTVAQRLHPVATRRGI